MKTRSIIGHARTIRTAVMVCEYINSHYCKPYNPVQRNLIRYEFTKPTPLNGCWSATIYYDGDLDRATGKLDLDLTARFVEICRAFIAGTGEIW